MQPLSKITKTVSPILNGRFDVVSLANGQDKDDFLSVKVKYIAVLPFERTSDNKIKAIYGLKFENPTTDQTDVTIVTDTINPTVDGSHYDSVVRALIEEAGLDIEKVGITEDDIFYIGNISTSLPATAQIKCYAVDFSKISNPEKPIEFARTLSKSKFIKDSSDIVKIGFHQVVNGDFSDSLILSGSFLLISYFN